MHRSSIKSEPTSGDERDQNNFRHYITAFTGSSLQSGSFCPSIFGGFDSLQQFHDKALNEFYLLKVWYYVQVQLWPWVCAGTGVCVCVLFLCLCCPFEVESHFVNWYQICQKKKKELNSSSPWFCGGNSEACVINAFFNARRWEKIFKIKHSVSFGSLNIRVKRKKLQKRKKKKIQDQYITTNNNIINIDKINKSEITVFFFFRFSTGDEWGLN